MHISSHCIYCHQLPEFCGSCPWSFYFIYFYIFFLFCPFSLDNQSSMSWQDLWVPFLRHPIPASSQMLTCIQRPQLLLTLLQWMSPTSFSCFCCSCFDWLIVQMPCPIAYLTHLSCFDWSVKCLVICILTQLSCFDWLFWRLVQMHT